MSTVQLDEICARAREAVAAGNYKDGRALYTQAVAESPGSPDAHYGLATCCFLLNDFDTALRHFKEVTRLDPLRATAFINLGALYNRLGQLDDAIAHLRKGLQLDPRRAEGYYNLGIAYRQKGMADLAIQAYKEATRLSPRMADAFLNLGNVLLETERYHEAAAAYKQALAARPNFDKAAHGLRNAEKALAAPLPTTAEQRTVAVAPAPQETPLAAQSEAVPPFLNVVERAEAMESLREAASKQEEYAGEIVRVLEKDLSPALHELSRSLVGSPAPGELELHVQNYEKSLQNLRLARANMDAGMRQIKQLGARFAATAQAGSEVTA